MGPIRKAESRQFEGKIKNRPQIRAFNEKSHITST
jgi:hypothetical protein